MPDVIPLKDGTRGQYAASIAMTLFLMSWGVAFATMFLAYAFLRARAPEWPPAGSPKLNVVLPILNTFVAAASSLAVERAMRIVARTGVEAATRWFVAGGLFGLVFLGLQCATWFDASSAGLTAESGVYAGTFFMLTWFHAAHVVAAIGVLWWLVARLRRGSTGPRGLQPVKLGVWFWHFVTGAWAGTFLTLYAF